MQLLRSSFALLSLVALTSGLVAPTLAAEPYDITVLMSMSGQAGFFGQESAKMLGALEAIVNRTGGIRGRPLHFVFVDDQSNPAGAVVLMNQIVAKNPAVVLGPNLGATCQAVAPLFKAPGPVDFCFSPVIYPPPGSFIFSASPPVQTFATAFLRYALSRGWKSLALLVTTDASGQDFLDRFLRELQAPEFAGSGVTIVANERFNVADISVSAQLARIKAANPQILLGIASGTPFGTLLRGYHESGLDTPVFGTAGAMSIPFLKQLNDVMPKELLFPGYPALVQMYRSKKEKAVQDLALGAIHTTGLEADAVAFSAVDPALIAVAALRAVGPSATAEQLRAYLANMHDFAGVYGNYDFRAVPQRGVGADNIIIERWDVNKPGFVAVSSFGGRPLREGR